MPANLDELAQAAYIAYAQYLGIFGQPGAKQWEDLPFQRQEAWRKAAAGVLSAGQGESGTEGNER